MGDARSHLCERFVSPRGHHGHMKAREGLSTKPERILLVVARQHGDCRGKAVRIADRSEFRFASVDELARWLADDPQLRPGEDPVDA